MKILKEESKRVYELTYLVDTSFTDSEKSQLDKKIEDLIKKNGGSVLEQEDWGKKPLAYIVKKAGKTFAEAVYTHIKVEFPTNKTQSFEKSLYIESDVVRHLLVIADQSVSADVEAVEEMVSSEDR